MGCPKVEEESHGSSPLNEALLLATMSIIGLPVYVHVKDGSVYSGIFYTASVENDFSIVLKNAKLTKKGTSKTNVPSGSVVETLVILSSNIVQVIAKGISFPSILAANNEGENVDSAMATVPSEPPASEPKEFTQTSVDGTCVNHRRNFVRPGTHLVDGVRTMKSGKDQDGMNPMSNCVPNATEAECGRRDGIEVTKNEDHHSFVMDERQAGAHILGHDEQSRHIHSEDNVDVQSSNSSLGSNSEQVRPTEEDKKTSKPLANGVCYDAAERPLSTDNSSSRSTNAEESSASCPDSLASSNGSVSPKITETAKRTKEFKLNPGAKIFSPAHTKLVSPTPAGMPTAGNMGYIPNNTPMLPVPEALQPEAGVSPFIPLSHASPPSKFAPHGNLTAGNGGTGSQFSQPIIGLIGNRAQPLRYASQYHPVQAAPMLVNHNSQVMVGRPGQLVYVQPASQDMVQGTPALSALPSRPLLTTPQVQYPKHQGAAAVASQPYQLCVPQPLGQQQPYAVPAHIQVLQPPYPTPNGFLGPKFP